jgi:hypothetical protein
VLKEPYDTIVNTSTRYSAFLVSGGWNGIKYLKVPVIQGKIKTTTLGVAQGTRFESLMFSATNCEDATNNVSRDLLVLKVNPTPTIPDNAQEWTQISNILLAGPLDAVYEVINMPDYSGVIFKVGDGINGQRFPVGATVTLTYLETAGLTGNVDKKYQITAIAFPPDIPMVDPRTNTVSNFLNVTNDSPIFGGLNAETQENLRADAPLDYLQYYAIATTEAYETQIKEYSQIGLDKVKVFTGDSATIVDYVEQGGSGPIATGVSQSVLYVTAISSSGEIIPNAQDTFVTPVTQAIGNLKAPTDTLVYVDPSFIQLRLNATVYSDSTDQSDQNVINTETSALLAAYSIFDMDFNMPFYNSEFVALTQSFPFVTYTDTFVEAIADMPLTTDNISFPEISNSSGNNVAPNGNTAYPILYQIHFNFNPIYGSNPYYQGFANYRQHAPYLLRIDLAFVNNPAAAATLNRTFFLFDDRSLYDPTASGAPLQENLTIDAAKYYLQDGSGVVTNNAAYSDWVRPDETLENFNNRAARIAQYAYISRITDVAFMTGARDFSKGPFEIRPYYVDSQGQNMIYTAADVTFPAGSTDPRVMLPGGIQCYKKDLRYIDYLDITFSENYDEPTSDAFATGSLTIPASFFGFTNINDEEQFVGQLNNFVSIKAYAHPLLTDLEPQNWNEIIFVSSEDIVVERLRTTSV